MVRILLLICSLAYANGLQEQYELHCREKSDIYEHLPVLKTLSQECSSVIEIGVREMVSTWAFLQGLADSSLEKKSYLGIDLIYPPLNKLFLADRLSQEHGITFQFSQGNDLEITIDPVDLLFIDSWHSYRHLTYELETFSPKVRKYIAMHDTSEPWGDEDEPSYGVVTYDYGPYDRGKKGLWPAVFDFLQNHPEWRLKERRFNNHGLTILERSSNF